MPNLPRIHNVDPATQPDTNLVQSPVSPDRTNTSQENHNLRTRARGNPAPRISNYDQNFDGAYGANPTLDSIYYGPTFAANNISNTHDLHTTAAASYSFASSSAHSANNASGLNLASSGSQPWPVPSNTYQDLAAQSVYEPTGELVHEAIEGFEQFDDPLSFRSPSRTAEETGTAVDHQNKSPSANTVVQTPIVNHTNQTFPKPALKRHFEPDIGAANHRQDDQKPRPVQFELPKARKVSFGQMSASGPVSADDEDSSSSEESSRPTGQGTFATSIRGRRGRGARTTPATAQRSRPQQATASTPSAQSTGGSKVPSSHPPSSILPPEKVFPIQIGSELFRLSGASISSDGYYVKPRDGSHFVKLFADAQFYSLPRLIDQLFDSEIFIQIGEQHFQISKDIFSDPGNSPNFFSLGFAVFFSTPGEVFPGLDRRGLLRPPSITPPYVPGRSGEIFAQILHLLRGYPLRVENEDHRTELLRDCRYFHLRGLEQKIIAHDISYNSEREQSEICLRIEDIKPSGISYKADETRNEYGTYGGWVRYARPFVDDTSYELIVEIGSESTIVDLDDMRADFHGLAKARVSSLFQVVANKMNLPTTAPLGQMVLSGGMQSSHAASPGHTPLSEDRVKVRFDAASDIHLDGKYYVLDGDNSLGQRMSIATINPHNDNDSNEDHSDAMSEGNRTQKQISSHRSLLRPKQRPTQAESGNVKALRSQNATTPQVERSRTTSRKRRRPSTSTMSVANKTNQWVLRNAQWRLRVQPNELDKIRGGYEIVFVAVKVDAFSQERARNARRSFLSSG